MASRQTCSLLEPREREIVLQNKKNPKRYKKKSENLEKIGISRIPAAIIEASNDNNGIVWPKEVSPFDVLLINLISNNDSTESFCDNLYTELKTNNYDVLLDDRSERPGIKFSDADLIGIPIQIIVGKNYVDKKEIGVKTRKDLKESAVASENLIEFLKKMKV